MLCNVISLLFLLLTVSAQSFNSFHKHLSTEKPDILQEDPSVSKPLNPPTHISEFTDPDTGLNPFLDIEEGLTFIGRNVMKDETREDPPFMDFEIVEGDASDRRWLGLDIPKAPIEEPMPRWTPFEEEVKLEAKSTSTSKPLATETDETTSSWTTVSIEEIICDSEIKEDTEQKIKKEIAIPLLSNVTLIYISVSVAILATVLLLLGSFLWRRRLLERTSRPPVTQSSELKC